jgi:hypothetical protein
MSDSVDLIDGGILEVLPLTRKKENGDGLAGHEAQ